MDRAGFPSEPKSERARETQRDRDNRGTEKKTVRGTLNEYSRYSVSISFLLSVNYNLKSLLTHFPLIV